MWGHCFHTPLQHFAPIPTFPRMRGKETSRTDQDENAVFFLPRPRGRIEVGALFPHTPLQHFAPIPTFPRMRGKETSRADQDENAVFFLPRPRGRIEVGALLPNAASTLRPHPDLPPHAGEGDKPCEWRRA